MYFQILSKYLFSLLCLSLGFSPIILSETNLTDTSDYLLGDRVTLRSNWIGKQNVAKDISILVMAGHADSQGIAGAGTAGEAVDLLGAQPIDSSMSDELFWNLLVRDSIVKIGNKKGLNISSYEPNNRNIINGNNPNTNWSVGARHAQTGGYPLEIHFDSYRQHGFGSGLIPAITPDLNTLDESLGNTFGKYPIFFRGGLGGPRRGIRILEVGKLEGKLEQKLRSNISRKETIDEIANRIVDALIEGIRAKPNF